MGQLSGFLSAKCRWLCLCPGGPGGWEAAEISWVHSSWEGLGQTELEFCPLFLRAGFLFRAKSVPLRLRSSPPLCPLPFKRASWALMVTARTDGTGLSVTVRGRQLFSVTRARAATTSVPLGITLLERLTEFRETHIYQLLKGYEKGHRCTSRWRDTRARFGRVLSTGASAPGDLGGASPPPPPRPVCGCSPTWRIPESPTIGIPWRLPHGE